MSADWDQAPDALIEVLATISQWDPKSLLGAGAGRERDTSVDLEWIIYALTRATPVYVGPEIGALASVAASQWKSEPIQRIDFPFRFGFVLLPRSVEVPVPGQHDLINFTDEAPSGLVDQIKRGVSSLSAFLWHSDAPLTDLDSGGTETGTVLATFERGHILGHPSHPLARWQVQWFHATSYGQSSDAGEVGFIQPFLRLMNSTVVSQITRRQSAQAEKRTQRADLTVRDVQVLTLRRHESERNSDARTVEWRWKWLVSGHWRRQWFPTLGEHKQMWISPYVKGPEKAPLLVHSERIVNFVR